MNVRMFRKCWLTSSSSWELMCWLLKVKGRCRERADGLGRDIRSKGEGVYEVVSVRLTGELDLANITAQLQSMVMSEKPVALHLDIGQVDKDSLNQLDELLFHLVILKCLIVGSQVTMGPPKRSHLHRI